MEFQIQILLPLNSWELFKQTLLKKLELLLQLHKQLEHQVSPLKLLVHPVDNRLQPQLLQQPAKQMEQLVPPLKLLVPPVVNRLQAQLLQQLAKQMK